MFIVSVWIRLSRCDKDNIRWPEVTLYFLPKRDWNPDTFLKVVITNVRFFGCTLLDCRNCTNDIVSVNNRSCSDVDFRILRHYSLGENKPFNFYLILFIFLSYFYYLIENSVDSMIKCWYFFVYTDDCNIGCRPTHF